MTMAKRALLSVSDKTGIVELAQQLSGAGYELISTGGTLAALQQAGVDVTPVETVTQFPEMLDGRVKTLHPMVHGGILARRDHPDHMEALAQHGITPIDIVVVNLYPFAETIAKPGVTLADAIEQIDIGGPSMIRAAAKNWRDVLVVTSPAQYEDLAQHVGEGTVSDHYRFGLAQAAFAHTAAYDAKIAQYLAAQSPDEETVATQTKTPKSVFPERFELHMEKVMDLRYGENPHQQAAFYRAPDSKGGVANAKQLHGKELSYNNLVDTEAAWQLACSLDEPSCAIIKHTNPCGFAVGEDMADAFARAFAADDVSAYGGIVACNREVDLAAAEKMRPIFFEVVIAPKFSPDALALLSEKKNIRLLEADAPQEGDWQLKHISGGLLLQDADDRQDDEAIWQVVTKRQPTAEEMQALRLAWAVVRHVKSIAIVVTDANATLGIGAGQMNRVGAAKIALEQAGAKAAGAVLASDAFFPFGDTVETAAKAGITAIIQPGGSIRDQESVEAADAAGIAMVCTGTRHFRHG